MTNQEAFDKVVKHLRKQGRKAAPHRGSCRYRFDYDGGTLMCAVGCLIPDDEYRAGFEGQRADSIQDSVTTLESLNEYLLVALQNVHDKDPVAYWEERLAEIAKDFDLTMPPKEDA